MEIHRCSRIYFVDVSKTNLLLLALLSPLLLSCASGEKDVKKLRVTRHGIFMKGVDSAISVKDLTDSLIPFCQERRRWLVEADSSAQARDVMPLFRAAMVRQPCKGLFHFKTIHSETWVMPPIPVSRNYYSIDESDTSKPVLCMTVYAHEFGLGLVLISGMVDPIHTVYAHDGLEYIQDPARKPPVAEAWIDEEKRCLVPLRQVRCVDTLEAHSRYLRVGQLDKLIDTIWSDSIPKDFKKGPLTLDIALRARLHVLRTLKGAMGRGDYYHLLADSTLSAHKLIDRISTFRRVNIDFNTVELH